MHLSKVTLGLPFFAFFPSLCGPVMSLCPSSAALEAAWVTLSLSELTLSYSTKEIIHNLAHSFAPCELLSHFGSFEKLILPEK